MTRLRNDCAGYFQQQRIAARERFRRNPTRPAVRRKCKVIIKRPADRGGVVPGICPTPAIASPMRRRIVGSSHNPVPGLGLKKKWFGGEIVLKSSALWHRTAAQATARQRGAWQLVHVGIDH